MSLLLFSRGGVGPAWIALHGFSMAVTTSNGVEALNKSLKSFYLKFSGTGSLSSMLETLVCEFVPEQLLSYNRLNFIYSSECKTYNLAVPAFLKDRPRPRSFVKRCLNSIKAASSYSKECRLVAPPNPTVAPFSSFLPRGLLPHPANIDEFVSFG